MEEQRKPEKPLVPPLRFEGFTEPWEQRKLGDVANFGKGVGYSKTDIKKEGTELIHYGRLYTAYELTIRSVDTFADQVCGSLLSKGGEVVTPSSGETANDIAVASGVLSPGILLGGGLNVIYPTLSLEPVFLALSISHGSQHAELAGRAQGKSVVHLYNADLAESRLRFPSASEQRKIGALFQKLDSLITLHQREHLGDSKSGSRSSASLDRRLGFPVLG